MGAPYDLSSLLWPDAGQGRQPTGPASVNSDRIGADGSAFLPALSAADLGNSGAGFSAFAGPTTVINQFGKGLKFVAASSQYLTVPRPNWMVFTKPFTFGLSIIMDSTGTQRMISVGDATPTSVQLNLVSGYFNFMCGYASSDTAKVSSNAVAVAGDPYRVVFGYDGASYFMFINGVKQSGTPQGGILNQSSNTAINIARRTDGSNYSNCQIADFWYTDFAVAPGDAIALSSGAVSAFTSPIPLLFPAQAASGSTGTAAVTQAADGSSAAGAVSVSGSSASVQTANTDSATGAVLAAGAASVTQVADTASAQGVVGSATTGTVSATQQSDTSSAVAAVSVSGSESATQQSDTAAVSGGLTVAGTSAVTQAANVGSATASLLASGSASVTQSPDAASATGAVGNTSYGSAASVQKADTASAAGGVNVSGSAALVQAANIVFSSGSLSVGGSAVIVQRANIVAASGFRMSPAATTLTVSCGQIVLSAVAAVETRSVDIN